MKLQSPQTLKEAQSLNGKLASLNRFLSKSAEKSLPFFKTLKRCIKKSDFQWTTEVEKQNMKKCIAELPMVTTPKPKEELLMYLCAAREAVSAFLLAERDSRQVPVYFVSRALQTPEINYSSMEKLVLALVHATRRLRRYFQAHPVVLEVFDITYRPRTSICGQILDDFIAEKPDEDGPSMEVQAEEEIPEPWTLFTDGSSCLEGSGAGLNLTSPEGDEFTYALRFEFDASNNKAEYKALVAGLRIAEQMGVKNLIGKVDSRLVASQINGSYKAKEQSMTQYLEKAKTLINNFKMFSIEQVPRSENKKANALSKIASTSFAHLTKQVLVETLKKVNRREGNLSNSRRRRRVLMDDTVGRIPYGRSGYYWPIMYKDARNIIRKCDDCQTHRPVPRNPHQKLTPITSSWPFYKWGIDILGPFPEGQGKVKFLIVAIDYFTKWIEAKPMATISGNQVNKFVWENIVCRFGLPGEIISDNGKQFRDKPFKDWCEKLNIKQRFASVKHPQTNGQVERANRSLREGIQARLGEDNRNWVEEVSHILWEHRTMIKTSNEDTPFSLTYGTEVVIPVEIGMPSLRCAEVNQAENDEGLLLNLDILEERREKVAVREARNKAKMEKYYNAKVRSTSFRPEDFVYRSNEASHSKESKKLGPKWEGPYEVVEALGKGAYKLRNRNGDERIFKKKAKNKPNQARDGKGQVKSKS
ncbi:reverse transcriptase domain-containing protein [Tanacetum coccineum]